MYGIYDRFNVKFVYPENWEIAEEQADDWPKVITLQSPGGAMYSLHIYEGGVQLRELVREAAVALQQEYAESESEELPECNDGADCGIDLHFYYLDFLILAQVRGILLPGKALLWINQAEIKEFEACEPIFKAMTLSLLGKVSIPPKTEA
jgi:hypothetical protein